MNLYIRIVLTQVTTQCLGHDTSPWILVEHCLLQADDVSSTTFDVLEDGIGTGLRMWLEAEGADVVGEDAQRFVFTAQHLLFAADWEVNEELRQGD